MEEENNHNHNDDQQATNFLQTPQSMMNTNDIPMTPLLGIDNTPAQGPMSMTPQNQPEGTNKTGYKGSIFQYLSLPPQAKKNKSEQELNEENQNKSEENQQNENQQQQQQQQQQENQNQIQNEDQQTKKEDFQNNNNNNNQNNNNNNSNNNQNESKNEIQIEQNNNNSEQNSKSNNNMVNSQNNGTSNNSQQQQQSNQQYANMIQQSQKIEIDTLLNPPNKEFVSKHLDNYLQQGKIFTMKKQFGQALKIYEIIVEHCPHQSNSWVLCGRAAFMQREYMKAMLAYQQSLQKNTMAQNDAKVWFDYAQCLFKLENYSIAETAFNKVISLEHNFQPYKGQIIVYLAIIKKLNFNYRACLDLLIKSLKEEGFTTQQTVAILCNIGFCLEMLKEPDESLGIYKKAFELNSTSFLALKCYAWHYFQNQQYKETLEIIWKMDETQFEQSFDCLFMTAKCFEAQAGYKDAMHYFNKAVRLNPQHATALCCLGMSFYKFNMFKDAFQCFQRAYQNDPSLLDSLFNIALLYEYSKNYSEAINIYTKLLQINPDDATVIKRKLAIEKGNFDQLSNDFPLREPLFKIKVELWLENPHSTYIPPPQSSVNSTLQKRQILQKEKKTSEQFGFLTMNQPDQEEEINNNQYQRQKTNSYIATTPLIQGQTFPSLLQQSPMPRWNFQQDDEQNNIPPSPYLLEANAQTPGYDLNQLNYGQSPGLFPLRKDHQESPYGRGFQLRKDSIGNQNRQYIRKASTFMQPSTPNMISKLGGTPSLGPMSALEQFTNTPILQSMGGNINNNFSLTNSNNNYQQMDQQQNSDQQKKIKIIQKQNSKDE